jgi:signal transduction histidine kinase
MTLLCAAGAAAIGAVLVFVSLYISEGQLTERGQALFDSAVNTVAFRFSAETTMEWEWLSQIEADGGVTVHLEDNGVPLLFSSRGSGGFPREELAAAVQAKALEAYGVDARKRPASALTHNQASFRFDWRGGQYRACLIVMRTQNGYKSLTVMGSTSAERGRIVRQRLVYLGLLAASSAATLLFAWWFTGRAVRPIAASRRQQAEFVAAASHELRTPLTVMRTNAAALLALSAEDGDGADTTRFATAIDRECARTSKLVDDLLLLSGADAGALRVDVAPVELEVLLRESAEAFRAAAEAKNQELELRLPPTLPIIAGDGHRLRQLCAILLDNACHYTPEGGKIAVSAAARGKRVSFTVADDGPGIPPGERERVFERFYRLDRARTQKERYGLGLPIAREIAAFHGGDIRLSETPGGGLTATVRFPAATAR